MLLVQHAARDEAGLHVAPHGEPREKIRVLENEAALALGPVIGSVPTHSSPELGRVEAGDQPQQRGFAAAARADERDQLAGADCRATTTVERERTRRRPAQTKRLAHVAHAQRGAFGDDCGRGRGYHLIIPFCQTSTRSRTLKSSVMIVEKNAAMMTSAA